MKNKISADSLKKKNSYTVVEFSPRRIKLVQSSTINKRRIITKLSIQDNISDSEDGFRSALDKIIKSNRLKVDNLLISLDRSLVTIRFIKLPSVNEEEIKNMAEWQAAKLLPYKIDEIVVSHQTIKVDESGFSQVLLAIVPKNIIKRFIDVCEALKLQPQSIALSSEGLLNWYVDLQSHTSLDGALALTDIEKDKAELTILSQNKFIFSRSFSLTQTQDASQIKKRIIDEVKLSIESYRKQDIFEPIKNIVLTGDKGRISDLSSLFQDEFSLPVEVIDHLENLNIKKDIVKSGVKENISLASISGLALSQRVPQINLLPHEIKDKILFLEKRKELFKTVTLALFAILVFVSIFGLNFYNKKKIIDILDSQIEKINPVAKEIQDIKNKIAIINAQLDNENSCIEILREIHRITPSDIYLNTFLFEETNEVTLKGTSPTMSLVFSFVPILNKSSFFENVQVRYATQRKMRSGELTDFEIICKLRS